MFDTSIFWWFFTGRDGIFFWLIFLLSFRLPPIIRCTCTFVCAWCRLFGLLLLLLLPSFLPFLPKKLLSSNKQLWNTLQIFQSELNLVYCKSKWMSCREFWLPITPRPYRDFALFPLLFSLIDPSIDCIISTWGHHFFLALLHFLQNRRLWHFSNQTIQVPFLKTPDVCRSSVFFQMGLLPQNKNHNANEVRLDQKC